MILHQKSHTDHISKKILVWVMHHFREKKAFFTETVQIPDGLPAVTCGLYGPLMGDDPVPEEEVRYQVRDGREWPSRLVNKPMRLTREITIIGGPYESLTCILYTAFGGPLAPREPGDPTLDQDQRAESEAFWKTHALSSPEKV